MKISGEAVYAALVAVCLGICLFSYYGSWGTLASVKAWGRNQHITLYSTAGNVIGEWDSDGQIQNEDGSDGFHFMDKATKRQVRVSGTTVTVTQ